MPKTYLVGVVRRWVASGLDSQLWDDDIAWGTIGRIDLGPLCAALEEGPVLTASSRMRQLLSGAHGRNQNFNQVLPYKPWDSPRHAAECNMAIVLRWESLAEEATEAKARDVYKKMCEAAQQLPADRPGIIHVGFEAVEGDEVERRRHDKIIGNAAKFDPQGMPIEWLYCHYFVPDGSPEINFVFDETTQWCPIQPTSPRPVQRFFLIVPPEGEYREGPHWQG